MPPCHDDRGMTVAGPGSPSPLGGHGILVTRPAARAVQLAALIRAAGGDPVLFPTLEIISITEKNSASIGVIKSNIINCDLLIFVSPTAVEHGLAPFRENWPATVSVAAVGAGTARLLRERGVDKVLAPDRGGDSEALVALPQLQDVAGKHVMIFRGEGGREWLADTLRSRGAQVEYAECYRRVCPDTDAGPLLSRWRAGGVAAVTVTSRQALDNLFAMLPDTAHALLRATPLFAAHSRIAAHARTLGVVQIVTTGPGDAAIVSGLQSFFATLS